MFTWITGVQTIQTADYDYIQLQAKVSERGHELGPVLNELPVCDAQHC